MFDVAHQIEGRRVFHGRVALNQECNGMCANSCKLIRLLALPAIIVSILCRPSLACDKPVLIAPAQIEIAEPSPRMEWSAVPDASHYVLRIESRVPEGRLLSSEEFRTSATSLALPRPLTADKATVRVELTAVCKDGTEAKASERVRIDAGLHCRLEGHPVFQSQEGRGRLVWEALAVAQAYEFRAYAAMDGKTGPVQETATAAMDLGKLPAGLWVLAVRPRCGATRGQSRYVTVAIP